MNKAQVKSLLEKEVRNSNLSDLAKALLEEMLDINKVQSDRDLTIVTEPKPAKPEVVEKPVYIRVPAKPKTGKRHKQNWSEVLDRAYPIIESRKRNLSLKRLAAIFRMPTTGGKYGAFIKAFRADPRFEVKRGGRGGKFIVSLACAKPAKHEKPMSNRKAGYMKFLSDRTKLYMKQGMGYLDASRMAVVDYSKFKGGGVIYEFPELVSVRADLVPILKDILKDMAQKGNKVGFVDIGYTLDITSEKAYNIFLTEIMAKSSQIAKSLGIDKTLVAKNGELCWV